MSSLGAEDQDVPCVIHPLLARLVHQRQRLQPVDPFVQIVWSRLIRRPEAHEPQLAHGLLDGCRVRRRHDHAEAHAEG